MSWIIENDNVYVSGVRAINDGYVISKPYPPVWVVENDNVSFSTAPAIKPLGAFGRCSSLTTVTIPASVTFIAPYAFAGTGINKVTIGKDCTYFDTSFPKDCEIIKV